MSIKSIETFSPNDYYYNMKDKLWNYVAKKSEVCFANADNVRSKIKTKDDFEVYIRMMRELFIKSLGGIPYNASLPLNTKITGVIEEENLVIEKIIFESRPHVYVTANLYLPKGRKEKCGAVLFQCGHTWGGKADLQYQKVARIIASVGLVVLVYDPVGQGERLSYVEENLEKPMVEPATSDHQYFGNQCLLVGDSPARYFICDAMRAIDYLQTRPEVDPTKIGITGSSGGGTMTSCLMVCDQRACAAAPATFITSRREYLYAGGAQDAEQIWVKTTSFGFDHHELLACFAPKPLLILAVDSDFFPIEGTKEVFNINLRFWDIYGVKNKLKMFVDRSEHAFTNKLAAQAAEFFADALNNEEVSADDKICKAIDSSLLQCTKSGQVAFEYSDAKFVFHENLNRYNEFKQEREAHSQQGNRQAAEVFLLERIRFNREPVDFNVRMIEPLYENGLKIQPMFWFSQKQMPNYGLMFYDYKNQNTKMPIVMCLWENGTDDIENNIYDIRRICESGNAAFIIDLSGMGKCIPNDLNFENYAKDKYGVIDRLTKDLFFANDSLCGLRLYELERALEMLKLFPETIDVSLYAKGTMGFYAKIMGFLNKELKTETRSCMDSIERLITSKYYENYNIASIIMPSLARYLDI